MPVSHVVEDQSAIEAWLADPATHGLPEPVERIETQSAIVFLAGPDVYKLKRAVLFPFMDLSTADKRRVAAENEITVNRDNAPDIYLGVLPINRTKDGLVLGGDPRSAIDWLVHMRRFDEHRTLDQLADDPTVLTPDLMRRIVAAVIASHVAAPVRDGETALTVLGDGIGQNAEAFAETPSLFPRADADRFTLACRAAFASLEPLLRERGRSGFVRRCHGDLHLRNIALIGDTPTLFDAIEFDDAIATVDTLHDLAFLIMDLLHRGFEAHANLILNRYLWASDARNLEGIRALPFFLAMRATIRAKVVAAGIPFLLDPTERPAAEAEARSYFALACGLMEPSPPRLVAVGGLSGSGKSVLAAAIAPRLGTVPGAVHLRSDIERKRYWGVDEFDHLPENAYAPDVTAIVYDIMLEKAGRVLASGRSVVVDAVYAHPDERQEAEELARGLAVAFTGIWLDAPEQVLRSRVAGRSNDASDASAETVGRQANYDVGGIEWRRIDAAREQAVVEAAALEFLIPGRARGKS